MRRVRESVLVRASPEAVWQILVDPNYIPKLYPDMLNISVEPPGPAVVGQTRTLSGRAGKRLIEFRTVVVGLDPAKRFELGCRRGGALEKFSEVIELDQAKEGTQMKVNFEFEVSEAYFGQMFDKPTLEQMAVRNQEVYIKNVKSLAELRRVR